MVHLVTGATGCLGFNLSKQLIANGQEVIALGRNQILGHKLRQMGAHFIRIDLGERERLQQIARPAHTIYHCAAHSSPWGRYRDFYQANVEGTQHVIAATPETTRLVHVSSPSIYFNFKEQYNLKEDAQLPQQAANPYVKTKLLAEQLIDKAYRERALNVITLRPRAIFGPYDRAILPRLLASEHQGRLPIIGNGDNLIDITYVANVVDSLLLAAQADASLAGKKYNITNGEPQRLLNILTQLFMALNKPLQPKFIPYPLAKIYAASLEKLYCLPFIKSEPRLTRYSAAVLALGQTLNIEAAQKDLDYQPQISIAEGMSRFAHWYQS